MIKIAHIPCYTYTDYQQWEGKWELIEGYPYAMSPSPISKHSLIEAKVCQLFLNQIDKRGCDCQVFPELDWIIDEHNLVRPDITVVCGKEVDDFLRVAPDIAVEILSPSTAYKDRHVKLEIYRVQGVMYYMIIDPNTERIVLYELSHDGEYIEKEELVIHLHDGCSFEFSKEDIFKVKKA